ncbi:Calx-beta domain-containing protein, partial [Patescibacteria group bacterium]
VTVAVFFISSANSIEIPECDGQTATIYVNSLTGKVVGGPNDGDTYTAGSTILKGTDGADVIVGTPDGDKIKAEKGDDLICALDGDNNVDGDKGDDTVFAGDGDDDIETGDGDDVIYAGNGDNQVHGGKDNDKIFTGDGDDQVNAYKGDDLVCTYGGNDKIYGGDGNDKLDANGGTSDWISGQNNYDRCNGGEFTIGCELNEEITECSEYTPPQGDDDDDDDDDGPPPADDDDDDDDGECDCDGKITDLTLKYLGSEAVYISVVQKKDSVTVYSGTVQPDQEFSFAGTDKGTLSTEIHIYVNGFNVTQIHTSCSVPIEIGMQFGEFLVVDGYSKNNGQLCGCEGPECDSDPECGDGTQDPGEQCDDGNLDNDDGCNEFCEIEEPEPECGDGNLDDGEQCDDGNLDNDDGCNEFCEIERADDDDDDDDDPYCGDKHVDEGEECDDGNNEQNDECTNQCKEQLAICHATNSDAHPYNFLWVSKTAQDGGGHDDHSGHEKDIIPITDLNNDGVLDEDDCNLFDEPECGDGDLDDGEQCDDGNNANGDGCNEFCEIEDDEIYVSISDAVPVVEGNISEFTVTLSNPSTSSVTVNYETVDGTAEAALDYTSQSGTITFVPGEVTMIIGVNTLVDSIYENTEDFNVNLSNPVNVIIIDDSGVGTIIDEDELPTVSISDAVPLPTLEGNDAVFTVTLSNPSTSPVTVNYDTVDGTAEAGLDYTSQSGTITFNPGEVTKTIIVSTIVDSIYENIEDFYANISNPVNATILDDSGIGSIVDEEPYCGDGIQNQGEQCDDGNNNNGDGCNEFCEIEDEDKIQLCHRTGSEEHPWVLHEVSRNSVDFQGHGEHEEDIIPVLDFDNDGDIDEDDCGRADNQCHDIVVNFGALYHGELFDEQYGPVGIHGSASAYDGRPNQLIIFDTNQTGTTDPDLEVEIGNAVIIPENLTDDSPADGLVDTPNDSAAGGVHVFTFDHLRDIKSFVYVDKDSDAAGTATAYDEFHNPIETVPIPNGGDGSVQVVTMTATGAASLEIDVTESGAITGLDLECTPPYEENADLGIVKTDSETPQNPIFAGDQFDYTLEITNYGPDASTGYTVVDTLPAGVTLVSANSTSGSCVEGPVGTIVCTMNALSVGPTATINITVEVDPGASGLITNYSEITSTNEVDPNPENDEDDEDTTIVVETDFAIEKTANLDSVVAGADNLTYYLSVTNNGPSDSTGYSVVDTLPAGTTFLSSNPSCTEAPTGTITCDMGPLAAGETLATPIEITVHVESYASPNEDLYNEATVYPNETDPNPDDNTDDETTPVNTNADLGIEISDNPDPVAAGGTLTYTLEITNHGPSDAPSYTVTHNLPQIPVPVSFVSAVPADAGNCSYSSGVVLCNLFNLSANDSPPGNNVTTVTVTVTVDPATPAGDIYSTATVGSTTPDSNSSNNEDDETTTVEEVIDLAVSISDTKDPVVAGVDTFDYEIEIVNNGPSDAREYTIENEIPAGISYEGYSSFDGTCTVLAQLVTCDMEPLPASGPGSTHYITINVSVDEDAEAGTVYDDVEAIPHVGQTDTNMVNNEDEEPTDIVEEVDFLIEKTDSPDPVVAGETISYTLKVTNEGPSDSEGSQIVDTLPNAVSFISSPDCTHSAGEVTCDLGPLAKDEFVTVSILVVVDSDAPSSINNVAVVTPDEEDIDTSNNRAEEPTQVEREADLSITKTDDEDQLDTIYVGDTFHYYLDIHNHGPSDINGYDVFDDLPPEVSFVSSVPDAPCSEGPVGTVHCSMPALAADADAQIEITVLVDSYPQAGYVHNDARVDFSEDPNPDNDEDDEDTDIDPSSDLAVLLTDNPDPVYAGNDYDYTLEVTNNGPVNSTGSVTRVTLPPEVGFESADPRCTYSAGVVECTATAIAVTGSEEFLITVSTDPSYVGLVSANAVIHSTNELDNNPSNDSEGEDTFIQLLTDLGVTINDNPDPVVAGTQLTYDVVVTNHGPSNSTGSEIEITLPSEVSFDSAAGCSHSTGVVTCNVGQLLINGLPGEESESFTILVTVDSSTTAPFTARVDITDTDQTDPNEDNDFDTEETGVEVEIDLSVLKDDEIDPLVSGENQFYSITVFNEGPSDASGYTIEDDLPAEVTFISADSPCTENAGTVTCVMGPLEAGKDTTINIEVNVTQGTRGFINNPVVLIDVLDPETNKDNNDDDEDTLVIGPELGSSKVEDDEDNVVVRGQAVTYTITLINNGETSATNVSVYDDLDDLLELTVQNLHNIDIGDGCSGEYVDNSTADPAILDIQGMIVETYPENSGCVITFTADVVQTVQDGSVIPNSAVVSFNEGPDQYPASDDLYVRERRGDDDDDDDDDGDDDDDDVPPPPKPTPEETCLEYNPDRKIDYIDNPEIWTKDYVDFLSRVYLTDKVQYIISGDGSLYGEHSATDNTTIRPIAPTNRFETVKIALTSFCIPIYKGNERVVAGEEFGARPDFPDFPRSGIMPDARYDWVKKNDLDFILDVMYTAYDHGIIDGRIETDPAKLINPAANVEAQAQWDDLIRRAEILKVFVNAADYDTKNSFMYAQDELQEFADYHGTTVDALTPDQILEAAINKWGTFYYDAYPNAWYAQYIPMVVKNRIVADVCMPLHVIEDPLYDYPAEYADEYSFRDDAAAYDCNQLAEDICIPASVTIADPTDERAIRDLAETEGIDCEQADEDTQILNFPPARFTFADNPAVRGEVFALDARMIWLTAATSFVNRHSNRNMKNTELLKVLKTQLEDNERSEFLFAIEMLVSLWDDDEEATEEPTEEPEVEEVASDVGSRDFFSSFFHVLGF